MRWVGGQECQAGGEVGKDSHSGEDKIFIPLMLQ